MSKEKVYNKLVRDRIPEIIEADGKQAVCHIADVDEMKGLLDQKLLEEVGEFIEGPCIEEIGDILEVLNALVDAYGFDWDELMKVQHEKSTERGGFWKRVVLERVVG